MNNEPEDSAGRKPSPPMRRRWLLVIARWVLVAAWIGVVLAEPWNGNAFPGIARYFAFGLLGFLLANALWQHMPLKRACAAAFVCAALIGAVDTLFLQTGPIMADGLPKLLAAIGGAGSGALLAVPLLKKIDRLIAPR